MNTQNDKASWTVKTVSGYAGGLKRTCEVTLTIGGLSDTVEHVRELTERALNEHDTLNAIAEAAADYSFEGTCENRMAMDAALSTLQKLREGKE